jgi:hypothetical protein
VRAVPPGQPPLCAGRSAGWPASFRERQRAGWPPRAAAGSATEIAARPRRGRSHPDPAGGREAPPLDLSETRVRALAPRRPGAERLRHRDLHRRQRRARRDESARPRPRAPPSTGQADANPTMIGARTRRTITKQLTAASVRARPKYEQPVSLAGQRHDSNFLSPYEMLDLTEKTGHAVARTCLAVVRTCW